MFEILQSLEKNVAIEAVYLAGLRIYEREFYPDWRKWLLLRPEPGVPTASDVATQLIDEIEERAGRPLAELGDGELQPFHDAIRERMDARYAETRSISPERIDQLLAEMRRDYGSHVRDAAA